MRSRPAATGAPLQADPVAVLPAEDVRMMQGRGVLVYAFDAQGPEELSAERGEEVRSFLAHVCAWVIQVPYAAHSPAGLLAC